MSGLYKDRKGIEYSVNYYNGIFYISARGCNEGSFMFDALPIGWNKVGEL